jgi:sugar transferase (PEP-CTERM/EpsH1 system associated)
MKILFLAPRVPYPLEKGDKLRAYLHVERLSREHEVHLVCLREGPLHPEARERLEAICSRLSILSLSRPLILWNLLLGIFSSKPFQVRYFFQWHLKKRLKRIVDEDPPDLIHCQLIRASEYVKDLYRIPKTIDYMDAFSKGLDRRRARSSFPFDRILKEEGRRTTLYENLIFEYFDRHIIISEQDRDLIPHPSRGRIHVLPNGIDTGYYRPRPGEEKDKELLFTGNMAYPPNIESARFLVQEILPLVWERDKSVKLLLAGVSPARRVRELESERVEVSGWVPDIRDAYARSSVFIAPMIMGSGLQNKLLEAMAMGLPCITTPLANRALGADPDEAVLIGRSKEVLAERILEALQDPELRKGLAEKGRRFVEDHYDLEVIGDRFERILRSGQEEGEDAERTI